MFSFLKTDFSLFVGIPSQQKGKLRFYSKMSNSSRMKRREDRSYRMVSSTVTKSSVSEERLVARPGPEPRASRAVTEDPLASPLMGRRTLAEVTIPEVYLVDSLRKPRCPAVLIPACPTPPTHCPVMPGCLRVTRGRGRGRKVNITVPG